MQELLVNPMLGAVSAMQAMLASISAIKPKSIRENPDGSVSITPISDPIALGLLSSSAQSLSGSCRELGLSVTLMALDEFRESMLPAKILTFEGLERSLHDVNSTFRREMKAVRLLSLSAIDQELYEKPALFGEEVNRVFPIAIEDIAEAGNCLALGRGTASVFHLMRTMEAALKGLASELGIPYAPSWESYMRQLGTLMEGANYDKLTADQKIKRPFYLDVLGDLTAIKSAWRNPTMHIVRSYDVKQAKRIYQAVEALMQHLAEKLEPVVLPPLSTGQAE